MADSGGVARRPVCPCRQGRTGVHRSVTAGPWEMSVPVSQMSGRGVRGGQAENPAGLRRVEQLRPSALAIHCESDCNACRNDNRATRPKSPPRHSNPLQIAWRLSRPAKRHFARFEPSRNVTSAKCSNSQILLKIQHHNSLRRTTRKRHPSQRGRPSAACRDLLCKSHPPATTCSAQGQKPGTILTVPGFRPFWPPFDPENTRFYPIFDPISPLAERDGVGRDGADSNSIRPRRRMTFIRCNAWQRAQAGGSRPEGPSLSAQVAPSPPVSDGHCCC